MPEVLQGSLVARGLKFAIVASRYNEAVTARLRKIGQLPKVI